MLFRRQPVPIVRLGEGTTLRFSFPDLGSRLVSNTDSRFRGKVLIVNITGSWCPNCHDEAPFLAELYRTYRARGLEVVALTFEEAEQLESLPRLHAFIERYRIAYPVLVAGTPEECEGKWCVTDSSVGWGDPTAPGRSIRLVPSGG